MTPGHLLLIVRLPSRDVTPSTALSTAFAELGCARCEDGAFEARIDPSAAEPLRRLVLACEVESAMVILHAELSPSSDPDQPYRRLWDRTDEHGPQIDGWKKGLCELPALNPGDLLRL